MCAAGQNARAARRRLVYPFGDALDFALGNHGAHVHAFIQGVADDQRVGCGDKFFGERFVHLGLSIDTLRADADLSAVVERADRGSLRDDIQIGVGRDNDGRGIAKFERHLFDSRDG